MAKISYTYEKLPIKIEAFRLGISRYLPDWFCDKVTRNEIITHGKQWDGIDSCDIPTLEGTMHAEKGDWIIKGVEGEIYPCKNSVFAATYRKVE